MIDTLEADAHGGILVPLDMFRISALAAITAEMLIGKARNILDARMVLVRHPESQIVLITIEGSVVGDDAADFWRDNADIAVALSRGLRTQCFLYYVRHSPAAQRREGFVVAQRGQVLAADDATADQQRPGQEQWPVSQLCGQLRVQMEDLAAGFPGGPAVEVSLVEPSIDDEAAIMTLAGQQPGEEPQPAAPVPPAQAARAPRAGAAAQTARPASVAQTAKPIKPKVSVDEDLKRREKEKAADAAAQAERAKAVESALAVVIDDLGAVVSPKAELSEPDVLRPFVVASIAGDLPPGIAQRHWAALQGKRCDIAVRVDFLSEVFVANQPLSRPAFEEAAVTRTIAGRQVRALEVLAPRLGYGTLVSTGKAPHVFVSRKPELPLPDAVIAELLG